jgi:hypothetical protein
MRRIHRQIRPARLPHRQDRGDHVRAARKAQPDHRFGAHAEAAQIVRQPIRPGRQFAEGRLLRAGDQGHRLRSARRLGGEQLMHPGGGRHLRRRVVPLGDDLEALRLGQDLNLVHRDPRVGGHRLQHTHEPLGQDLRGSRIEQIRRHGHRPAHPGRAAAVEHLAHDDVQVELGRRHAGGQALGLEAGQVEHRHGVVLHHQLDLEQRVPGQRTVRSQVLDQALERHVLVFQRAEPGRAHPVEQFGERRIPGQVRAQDQSVDEEADEIVQGLVRAPGRR